MYSASARPFILDGAMGTQLESRGVATPAPLWSAAALESDPAAVLAVHRDYVAAGAEILVANTFRTNPRSLRKAGQISHGAALNRLALDLARRAAATADRRVWVAASVAPVEDCYRPDLASDSRTLAREHLEFMHLLRDAGATLVWIETIGTVREAAAAAGAAREAGVDFAIAFILREDGRLLSGESLEAAVRQVCPHSPLAIGLNCIPPRAIHDGLVRLADCCALPRMAYGQLSAGAPLPGWSFAQTASPSEYAQFAMSWICTGAAIIGGCCGTTPEHIQALAAQARSLHG
ncbi:MAG: homocysteine S-methyltransferase family protein [Phycisphaerales bacterium]|nr:homocysteine S-methyltransferase family protein [Phycisphaerales bacterium]